MRSVERLPTKTPKLRIRDADGSWHIGFIFGKAKLAPWPELPRLELCAAVLAVNIAELVSVELDIRFDNVSFFTEFSK